MTRTMEHRLQPLLSRKEERKLSIHIIRGSSSMKHAIRFVRPLSPATTFASKLSAAAANYTDMAQNDPKEPSGDSNLHSYGEGYSTRSDDDGFGGICGPPKDLNDQEDEKLPKNLIKEGHPDFDKTQGSKVAEKEKARCQK